MSLLFVLLTSCSWFTDFKEQPKIDPWDSKSDTIPPRGNPQGSVPITGSIAPEYAYPRTFAGLAMMASLTNPVAPDSASVSRGRKLYQINCAVCHGPLGMGDGAVKRYGFLFPPPALVGPTALAATTLTDGGIFGIIRNGRGQMPSYNRIEEPDRWDVVNYLRSLQGKLPIAPDSSHGLPGETGDKLPGLSRTGPTRPAPYFRPIRMGIAEPAAAVSATPVDSAQTKAAASAAKKPTTKPPTPEFQP